MSKNGFDGAPGGRRGPGKGWLAAALAALMLLPAAAGCSSRLYPVYPNPADEPQSGPTAPPDAEMPDLMNEPCDAAEQALAEIGIEPYVLFVSSQKMPVGRVTLQSISPGRPVRRGQENVVLYVSLGPAPTPTPMPSAPPTPTPRPTPKPARTPVPEIVIPVPTPRPGG